MNLFMLIMFVLAISKKSVFQVKSKQKDIQAQVLSPINNIYSMGCISSQPKQNVLQPSKQEKALQSNDISVKMATAPDFRNHELNANSYQTPVKVANKSKFQSVIYAEQENAIQLDNNKSGRPGWNVNQAEQKPTNENRNLQQSAINVIYSSDAKEGATRPNLGTHSNQNLTAINPITQVPSALEVDSRKISAPDSQNLPKHEDHFYFPDSIQHKNQSANAVKIMEVDNINVMVPNNHMESAESRFKIDKKVHGQQQTLQSYQQKFQLPILQISLPFQQ